MALTFDLSSDSGYRGNGTPVTAAPFSFACWFKTAALGTVVGFIGDSGSENNFWWIRPQLTSCNFRVSDTAGITNMNVGTGYSDDVWHHACLVEALSNDRRGYMDGTTKGTNSVSRTPSGVDRLSVGLADDSTPTNRLGGEAAEIAVWDVALSDDEAAILGLGYSPLLVRPQSLVFYNPLFVNGDNDRIGDITFTDLGSDIVNAPHVGG